MAYQVPLKYNPTLAVHEPMAAGDEVPPANIPVSTQVGNTLERRSDGLYSGIVWSSPAVIYVSSSTGSDVDGAGGRTNPFQTLDFCLNYLAATTAGQFRHQLVIALKASDTFSQSTSFFMYGGRLTLAFYDDPKYGDWTDIVEGKCLAAYMSDLQRPIINCGIAPSTNGGSPGFVLLGSQSRGIVPSTPSALVLQGIRVNLPTSTHVNGQRDYVGFESEGEGTLILQGSVINMQSTSSVHGLLGVEASSQGKLYQFSTQLLVEGQQIGAGATVAQLQARSNFIKFYPDFLGNDQAGIPLTIGSAGTGLLTLSWTDTQALPIAGVTNQATYPALNNASYGLGNYIFNLTRDQQSRPLNVISGRLF